jgi:hypothetical protein
MNAKVFGADEESDEGSERLRKFAAIYQEKMAKNPYMEIIARYDSMTEAGLTVQERIKGDLLIETHRLNELLHPCEVKPFDPPKIIV